MLPIMAIGAIVQGLGGISQMMKGKSAARKAAEEAKVAKAELEKNKALYANLDTSNPYLNLENNMEDLTVNLQEAEFTKQQQMQSQANIMDQMRGAAGGSGIAALAQTMANQSSMDAQKASVSIGKQEAANQAALMGEKSRIQGLEREGDLISRQAEHGKVTGLMGMSADALTNANMARANAQDQISSGMSAVGSAAMNFGAAGGFGGGIGGAAKTVGSPTMASNQVPTFNTTPVPVVGGTGTTGGISTPSNIGGTEIIGGSGLDYSFNTGGENNQPTYQYIDGVLTQIN